MPHGHQGLENPLFRNLIITVSYRIYGQKQSTTTCNTNFTYAIYVLNPYGLHELTTNGIN